VKRTSAEEACINFLNMIPPLAAKVVA